MTSESQEMPSVIHTVSGSVYVNGEKYPLPEQVVKNIETVIKFQAKQVRNVAFHERIIGKVAAFFGKSQFLYAQLIFFTLWWAYSNFMADWVPLPLLKLDLKEMGVDIAALLIATGVLIQQSRQDKLAEQRSHLTLQINLLTEQKIAKLIKLVEELRTDLPGVRDRYDWEAATMQQATDPQIVLDILQDNLERSPEEERPQPELSD